MDKVTEDPPGRKQGPELNRTVRPCEELALSDTDISAVMKDIDRIKRTFETRPGIGVGMVYDNVIGWVSTNESGEDVSVAIKKPRSVSAEKIATDVSRLERELIERGEFRFAPTYRLPGQELLVQRFIEQPHYISIPDGIWKSITSEDKGIYPGGDGNVLYDKKYGPIIIDVFNITFDKKKG